MCAQIAEKHSQAVDFAKTGMAPKQLTMGWNEKENIPPEKYEKAPNFMDKEHEVSELHFLECM